MDNNNSNSRDEQMAERVKIVGKRKSYDENDSSISSNDDGVDGNADETSLDQPSQQLSVAQTSMQGQPMGHNPVPVDNLAAKREYNRQNAARARKRAKTLLNTYQEQIKILTTQLAQLRDQNRYLLATLSSLREENISIRQSQLSTATNVAGTGVPPSILGTHGNEINTTALSNSAPLPSEPLLAMQNLLALVYLTGVLTQQSSASTHQQPQHTSSLTQQQIAPNQPQMIWPSIPLNVLQLSPPNPPSSTIGNHQLPPLMPYNYDAVSHLSLPVPTATSHSNNVVRDDRIPVDTSYVTMTTATNNAPNIEQGETISSTLDKGK